ncbi:unnamed protein product [Fraxinus pennsylvanica]|uniref:Uncharacterized protein n=1 Tax=Fraxinus pennsylvanica TaxID=56036 RepID=A0AAD1ZUP8_9LAMI|nr:unnamed protein product [Fraxinus pennsylvanica]
MAKVIVASLRKLKGIVPADPKELYELDLQEYTKKGKYRIDSTPSLRLLNKACVKTDSTSPWMLCPVTQVEETKQMLRMIPILIATFIPSTMIAQINTLFVKQGTTLNRHVVGKFNIPPASLAGFVTLSMLISVVLYDQFFVKIIRKWTKNPRGITLLQRMGIVAEIEFFHDQAPESMKSLGTSYSMISLGAGNFISNFLLSTVSRVTKENGHHGWIQNNLNASHFDYYYAFFAILNCLNFIFFLVMIKFYVYKAQVSDSMRVSARGRIGSIEA